MVMLVSTFEGHNVSRCLLSKIARSTSHISLPRGNDK